MTDGEDLSAKVEKPAASKPFKILENLNTLYATITLLIALTIGVWHFFTTPLTNTSDRILKTLWFSITACSSLGIGIVAAFLVRFIFWRKRGLKLVDAILGTPIAIGLMFYLRHSDLDGESIFQIVLYGFVFFLITVLFPFLHKGGVIEYTQPPPWQGALRRFRRWLRDYMDIWSEIKPHTKVNSKNPGEKPLL